MGKKRTEIKHIFACSNRPNLQSPHFLLTDYADTVFGSDLEESDYSFLLQKIDRYNNGSSYTSDSWTSPVVGEETPTSKLVALEATDSIDDGFSQTCKKQLFLNSNPESQGLCSTGGKNEKGYDLVEVGCSTATKDAFNSNPTSRFNCLYNAKVK